MATSNHFFLSYSAADGSELALKLANHLMAGPPPVSVWFAEYRLRPGYEWDEQIVDAIRTCRGLLFVMTVDSVRADSVCKNEWVWALKYKKPIIPLRAAREAELPPRLESLHYIDLTGSFDSGLAKLRTHLTWMDSPAGQLQALKDRLADAQRELARADAEQQPRIEHDITELERQIAAQQQIVDNPAAAAQRVQDGIDRALALVREPAASSVERMRIRTVNPPPVVAPAWFQNRDIETGLIANFLADRSLRVFTVVGRGGIGKSAMVCRLLASLEQGQLRDGRSLAVNGIVYLSNARRSSNRVSVPDLYVGLCQLLPEAVMARVDAVYTRPQAGTRDVIQALAEAFRQGRTIVLLDEFEEAVAVDGTRLNDPELDEALRALLELPPHGLKIIITTRIAPRDLALIEPGRQQRIDLDSGLESPYAENVLRAMDVDAKVGLKNAPDALLSEARERTRGYPRALEHLYGILSADRDTSLAEILDDTRRYLPEQVEDVLVGEAFSRLDPAAQRAMQGLAVFGSPVPAAAVDFLLQPYRPGAENAPVLRLLVNMRLVRREPGRYSLHALERSYVIDQIPSGNPSDGEAHPPGFTRAGLRHRAAEWFKLSRKREEARRSLADLDAHLAELSLRMEAEDYDAAADVLRDAGRHLLFWGHYRLIAELHEPLRGRVTSAELGGHTARALGSAYFRMGQQERAIACFEEALRWARDTQDRKNEGVALGSLGGCVFDLGQIAKAIDYFEQALVIRRDIADREGEGNDLGNLATAYAELGQTARALAYGADALALSRTFETRHAEAEDLCNQGERYRRLGETTTALEYLEKALDLARSIGYRLIESATQAYIGSYYAELADWNAASHALRQSIAIADELRHPTLQAFGRWFLGLVSLYSGKLTEARTLIEEASLYGSALQNTEGCVVRGVVAVRQGDTDAAVAAFTDGLSRADGLLAHTPDWYAALDARALALCGLVVCGQPERIAAARDAYSAARAVTSDPGIVRSGLQLFDALAQADADHLLDQVRPAAAGTSPS